MHGLTINQLVAIENINHPEDYYIYFNGGYLVWNVTNGPLRFWYNGELIQIITIEDITELRHRIEQDRIRPIY